MGEVPLYSEIILDETGIRTLPPLPPLLQMLCRMTHPMNAEQLGGCRGCAGNVPNEGSMVHGSDLPLHTACNSLTYFSLAVPGSCGFWVEGVQAYLAHKKQRPL